VSWPAVIPARVRGYHDGSCPLSSEASQVRAAYHGGMPQARNVSGAALRCAVPSI